MCQYDEPPLMFYQTLEEEKGILTTKGYVYLSLKTY